MAPADVPAERKSELLRSCDEAARAAGGEVSQVQASYAENRRRVTVANSEGRFAADDRTRVRLGVQVVAAGETASVETGFETLGGHRGFELVTEGAGEKIAERAARRSRSPCSTPTRPPPGRCPWWSAAASAASCSTR